ncbi:Uu.00g020910.m01.CDS01 [Anthostomella pinea]|uniref:Uu.00g020910.m01.CDS01 n=1 Tax=Anthostomella pinea TaxID=933095 RepID=A0AAI8VZL3_9PEZI|nr:Uu.00g020910.m01.CDS01 [Anthostomella pinea]
MAGHESSGSTMDISQLEKSFPAPPESSHGDRKSLPELPLLAEIQSFSQIESPASSDDLSTSTPSSSGSSSSSMIMSPSLKIPEDKELPPPFGIQLKKVHPPSPISKEAPRPMTASTRRLSFSSIPEPKRRIRYGTGKYAGVELSPQPSDNPEDPLNWPMWKKHMNFLTLLSMVALVGAMKTAFVTVNSFVAIDEGVSYTAAVGLTAVPLMVSALTGMTSTIVAKIWGKRPIYLVSSILIFAGAVWNIMVRGDLAQNMGARVLQGLGWGAFDTLVVASIRDTYFEHERQSYTLIYHAVSVGTTWGSPLLGGVASNGPMGFALQFEIVTCFLVVLTPLLVLAVPETSFARSSFSLASPTITRSQSLGPKSAFSKDAVVGYLSNIKLLSYKAQQVDSALLTQAPRAMLAPSTLLLFAVTLLPYVGLWSLTSSLSLLFSPMPFMFSEASTGALMTGPFILATAVAIASSLPFFQGSFTPTVHYTLLATGTAFAAVGIFGFGLYLEGSMQMPTDGSGQPNSTPYGLSFMGARLSFPIVSLLLGFLAAGSLALDACIQPVIQRSTNFTSADVEVGLRNAADMQAGLMCMRNLVAGAFILGVPNMVWEWEGLKAVAVGMGAAQLFVAAAACGVWWSWDENVKRLDGRVMRLVDLLGLKKQGSFFDMD